MPTRVAPPVASEHDLDIAASLFSPDELQNTRHAAELPSSKKKVSQQLIPGLEDSESDDAAYIASSLVAANRKASNVKGNSVKKGGGFQAMGLNANLLKAIHQKGFSVPTPIQRVRDPCYST